jgi:hypothetical protein
MHGINSRIDLKLFEFMQRESTSLTTESNSWSLLLLLLLLLL